MVAQYDINDLLRVIGIKELVIMQLRLENLRLRQALQAAGQARPAEGAACQDCQGCQREKGEDETEKN